MIIIGDDFYGIAYLKIALSHHFAMKDLGVLCYFLGVEVAFSSKGYILSQSKYIANLFKRARLTDNKIVDIPFETSVRYSPSDGVSLNDSTLHRTIVESLIYLIMTHPNIAHVVSQFVLAPTTVH